MRLIPEFAPRRSHSSPTDATDTVLRDETPRDCLSFEFDTGDDSFCVQFLVVEDGGYVNLCSLDHEPEPYQFDSCSLWLSGEGNRHYVFESDATDVESVLSDMIEVASIFDASFADLETCETYGAARPMRFRIPGWLDSVKSMLSRS